MAQAAHVLSMQSRHCLLLSWSRECSATARCQEEQNAATLAKPLMLPAQSQAVSGSRQMLGSLPMRTLQIQSCICRWRTAVPERVVQRGCAVATAGQEEEQDSEELGEHLLLRIDDGREGSVGSHDTDGDSDGEGAPHPLGQEAGDPM